ncbi:hypothetical protein [Frigoriglobus tundricola]|uniref:Uncharacterized protein n=1 Tax=Frigoriglobus tundricola TaxID=2774151 RepID=A0A6M5YII9_9BACT|nr:hypothetical protein [Frigoriglobus tundricola]QJW93354.1 hypothetical protein FTUN_0860 [Frigoriglobus tundricola]
MSIRSFFTRVMSGAAVAAALAWSGSPVRAADVPAPVPAAGAAYPGAAPVSVSADPVGCATCQHGATKSSCATCSKSLILGNHANRTKGMYQVNLAPGACFGYFQTQWRKWDEVCPYPYLGTGVNDAPRPPAGVLNPKAPGTGGELNPPRPVEPKKTGSDLPPIPQVPGKFAP